MRANAMENLLKLMEAEIHNQARKPLHERNMSTLVNLAAKSYILRDRSERSASVVAEMSRYGSAALGGTDD
jgi:hypothetical protein